MINENSKITLFFSLTIEGGNEVDSNFGKDPATFEFGDGSLLPGFEKALLGLSAGDKKDFLIEPKDAFGPQNPNNVQRFKRSTFQDDVELVEGLIVSFADASGSELPGVISGFEGEEVVVDFNHPLAGRNITFSVEIVDVQ